MLGCGKKDGPDKDEDTFELGSKYPLTQGPPGSFLKYWVFALCNANRGGVAKRLWGNEVGRPDIGPVVENGGPRCVGAVNLKPRRGASTGGWWFELPCRSRRGVSLASCVSHAPVVFSLSSSLGRTPPVSSESGGVDPDVVVLSLLMLPASGSLS